MRGGRAHKEHKRAQGPLRTPPSLPRDTRHEGPCEKRKVRLSLEPFAWCAWRVGVGVWPLPIRADNPDKRSKIKKSILKKRCGSTVCVHITPHSISHQKSTRMSFFFPSDSSAGGQGAELSLCMVWLGLGPHTTNNTKPKENRGPA